MTGLLLILWPWPFRIVAFDAALRHAKSFVAALRILFDWLSFHLSCSVITAKLSRATGRRRSTFSSCNTKILEFREVATLQIIWRTLVNWLMSNLEVQNECVAWNWSLIVHVFVTFSYSVDAIEICFSFKESLASFRYKCFFFFK